MYRVYVQDKIGERRFRFSAEFPSREDAAEFIRLSAEELPLASLSMRPLRYPTPSECLNTMLNRRNIALCQVLAPSQEGNQEYQALYERLCKEIAEYTPPSTSKSEA